MTAFYGSFDHAAQEAKSLRTISKVLEVGVNMLDTAWIYQSFGAGGGGYFTNEELIGKTIHQTAQSGQATKFGFVPSATGFEVSENTIRFQLADSLERLGTTIIDLYYMHRMDRCLRSHRSDHGGAQASRRRTQYQMEWSLQSRYSEADVVPTARELGVGIVAYSPMCRGFLGAIDAFDKLEDNDRTLQPRIAKSVNPSQLTLGWVHAQGDDVFPRY
ncbi:hypothetical protein H257_08893 [Aphanomyces astaci]|uniref:NADP-dependent oxidoreductase domain-containing protein n=1 Tax=Aphanomyces astaci TaxID=112090 RepID=W4GCR9_APHAT|nr:hypothetical protein H257_08893 [Aphanomyces astaci]ETV77482.1 hypothetical protein H257_08893 [Aphanomyces astaci]|eukprot:XP_009833269.1 hypothetical protein H257_08893 [Aphanomyces astaci]